jgi:hypothetical protein
MAVNIAMRTASQRSQALRGVEFQHDVSGFCGLSLQSSWRITLFTGHWVTVLPASNCAVGIEQVGKTLAQRLQVGSTGIIGVRPRASLLTSTLLSWTRLTAG